MTIRLLLVLSLIYTLILLLSVTTTAPNNKLEITFFDVGQGDSIYIRLPTGERILIDGGEFYDVDNKINNKFMYPFCNFDYIFITHPHIDHYGGLKKVTQHCNFKYVTFNDIDYSSKSSRYFLSISNKKSVLKGDIITLKDVTLKVLWPELENTNVDYSNVNNLSVVLFLDYGSFEAIFTGDAESDALSQVDIQGVLPYIQGKLDVYKVSHHGAINGLNKSLLAWLKPEHCVISVGKDNKYGHPDSRVLEYLKSIECNILRTDEMGDITFIF